MTDDSKQGLGTKQINNTHSEISKLQYLLQFAVALNTFTLMT